MSYSLSPSPSSDHSECSEVEPDILDDLTDDEENQGSSRRRRARTTKSTLFCPRCEEIKNLWRDEVQTLTEKYSAAMRLCNEKDKQLREIKKRREGNTNTLVPWTDRLDEQLSSVRDRGLTDEDTRYPNNYGAIYLDSCKQGNMSTNLKVCHPDLYLEDTRYTLAQIKDHFADQMLQDRCDEPSLQNATFWFENLPVDLQCHIWKYLVPNSKLIHCLSRLDPVNPPLDLQPGKVRFPGRFHIGNGPCCIAKADKPSRYLDYLLVSKRWCYAIAHLFYASNTFAFSSLGEFGRFCSGIGKSRVERLVNIEIMWTGASMPMKPKKGMCRRKEPLSWLMHTSRLRTLCVHINETHRSYMRRRNEVTDSDSRQRTYSQPNSWKNRNLRAVKGMDYIYQLRGMRWVRFYDTNDNPAHTPIFDYTFLQDVSNQVEKPKSASLAFKTQIRNLRPLTGLGDFNPDVETAELVRGFYDEIADVTSVNRSETPSSRHSMTSSGIASSDSEKSDFDDSDSDDSDDFIRNLTRRPRKFSPGATVLNATACSAQPEVVVIEDNDSDSADSSLFVSPHGTSDTNQDNTVQVRVKSEGSSLSGQPIPSDPDLDASDAAIFMRSDPVDFSVDSNFGSGSNNFVKRSSNEDGSD
ncbi:hypothetical protein GGS21DRAFT_492919 [Xylaria nigripes]|nr:hypothetical protein GGS21DRAFT_492919 [Xylaria nigripes]